MNWNGYKIMQNEKFMRIYCKYKNLEFLKIGNTIVYFHKLPVFGYTFMKMHSPDLENFLVTIQKAQTICKERNAAILEILTPYKENTIEKYIIESGGTFIMNLNNTEDFLWKHLNKKTRNEVRQAEKKGVIIKCAKNEDSFYEWWNIYESTARNKKFGAQPRSLVYETFKNSDISRLFVAKVEDKIVSGAFLLINKVPQYWLGATDLSYSKYRPNNLLHWEIIKWAEKQKYPYYDLGGAVINKEHGPTKFKRGFGGEYRKYYIYRIPISPAKSKIVKIMLDMYAKAYIRR